ncbi:unnamed protein product [Cochlearia groenlandica]
MSTIHRNRPILISLLLFFFFCFLTTTTVGSDATVVRRNFRYRTYRFVPRVNHHPYYSTSQRSCDSFSRPYALSMCLELQRIHRSSKKQPLLSPPPPPPLPEIDPRYGVDKRLVPSGPNPLHN